MPKTQQHGGERMVGRGMLWRSSSTGASVLALIGALLLPSFAQAQRPVTSLLEMRQDRVVVQEWDISCGAAALATILNYQHGDPISEREIARGLIAREEYLADPDLVRARHGFSLLDLKRFVDRRGYKQLAPAAEYSLRFRDHPWLRSLGWEAELDLQNDPRNRPLTRELGLSPLSVSFEDGSGFELDVTRQYERLEEDFEISDGIVLPVGAVYRFTRYGIRGRTADHRIVAIEGIKPEMFDGTPWREAYDRAAPQPEAFPTLVAKLTQLDMTPFTWPPAAVQAITAPTMFIIGDSDGTRPEHAVEMFRLRGGGVFGDLAGLPAAQLAILPGTTHVGMLDRADWLLPMIEAFLDAPMPATA